MSPYFEKNTVSTTDVSLYQLLRKENHKLRLEKEINSNRFDKKKSG